MWNGANSLIVPSFILRLPFLFVIVSLAGVPLSTTAVLVVIVLYTVSLAVVRLSKTAVRVCDCIISSGSAF